MAKSTAIVKPDSFDILKGGDLSAMSEVMIENLSGVDIGPGDLEIIKFPSGGSLAWEIEGDDGATEYEKEFSAVIIHVQKARGYWEKKMDEDGAVAGSPPICFSRDGIVGEGSEASKVDRALCANCPMSKFGADNEKPRCKETRAVFVLRPGRMLPSVLRVPPTSLRVVSDYMRRLISANKARTGVVTTFSLEKKTSDGGHDYGHLVCSTSADQTLSPEQRAVVKQYIDAIGKVITQFSQNASNLVGEVE